MRTIPVSFKTAFLVADLVSPVSPPICLDTLLTSVQATLLAFDVQTPTGTHAHCTDFYGCSGQAYVICGFGGLTWVLPLRKTLVLTCVSSK